ncbi:MAG: M16 family metallopeptidase [Planctomycetota bacterium]
MSRRAMGDPPVPELPVERFELSCGARLLVSSRADAPLCALQLHVAGAFAEDPLERAGLAHLVGALAPEGTRSRSDEDLADALEPHGGSLSGDSTGLVGVIEGAHWQALVDVTAEVVCEPSYPKQQVDRRRDALLDRLTVEAADPRVQAARRFRQAVYGDHWLGRPERGEHETVARIERRHLTAYHRQHWVARRATIAVCGDVEAREVFERFERRLAGWKPGTQAPPVAEDFPAPRRRVSAFRASRQQVHLFLGHLGIRRDDPDYAAVAVLDHVLGTGAGFTNRIAKRLRDDEGLAYSVYASQYDSAGRLPGVFSAYIGTSPTKIEAAVHGMVEEIARIRDEPGTEEELSLARDSLIGSYVLGFERAKARVNYILFAERMGFGQEELVELPRRIAAVGIEDVQRAARRCLRPEELCLSGAGPVTRKQLAATLEAALSAEHPNVR